MESRRLKMVLALLAAGGLAVLVAVAAGKSGSSPTFILGAVIAGAIVVVGLILVVIRVSMRSRRQSAADRQRLCEQIGFRYEKAPGRGFLSDYRGLPGITRSATPAHLLTGRLDDRHVQIFQATYQVHTGQASVPVTHTYYVVDAPDWPMLSILPQRGLRRLLRLFGSKRSMELERPRFNASFHVETIDDDFALTLLSPAMQDFLLEKPGVRWCIRPNRLILIYNGALRLGRVEQSLQRLRAFWTHIPPELELWRD